MKVESRKMLKLADIFPVCVTEPAVYAFRFLVHAMQ